MAHEIPFRAATMSPIIEADEQTRTAFLVRVYQHLGLAILSFIAFEAVLFTTGIAEMIYDFIFGNRIGWLLLLGAVMVVSSLVAGLAYKLQDSRAQYLGLFGSAAAEAVIFAPFLYGILVVQGEKGDVGIAMGITLVGFAALTAVAFVTRSDLSFLRPVVIWGSVVALGLIVASLLFGFVLGPIFSVAMIGLMGAAILYKTQEIVRSYPYWAHVGAAVSLFSSLMTMFWYVLRLVNSSRD